MAREYKRRLKEIEKELQTATGLDYILLTEEKENLEWLLIETE